jgi:quercetin dioxygenase-like cupin family protein
VAGAAQNHNPAEAALNPKLAIGLTALLPGNSGVMHSHPHPETYLVLSGTGAVTVEGETAHLGRLDAAYFPVETLHVIRNTGDQTLHVLWSHELG